MALINCPECGAQVSDKAASCPKCGHPINQPASAGLPAQKTEPAAQQNEGGIMQTPNFAWMAIAIFIAIVALFALIGTCNWAPL